MTKTPKDDDNAKKDKKKKSRKDVEKSTRDKNRALRTKYLETLGKGMKETDIVRAKLLIERDERKKLKRQQKQQ